MKPTDQQSQRFALETWIVRRLDEHSMRGDRDSPHAPRIFEGLTDFQIRKQRIREEILMACLESTVIGENPGRASETFADFFERFYGEPLSIIEEKRP